MKTCSTRCRHRGTFLQPTHHLVPSMEEKLVDANSVGFNHIVEYITLMSGDAALPDKMHRLQEIYANDTGLPTIIIKYLRRIKNYYKYTGNNRKLIHQGRRCFLLLGT